MTVRPHVRWWLLALAVGCGPIEEHPAVPDASSRPVRDPTSSTRHLFAGLSSQTRPGRSLEARFLTLAASCPGATVDTRPDEVALSMPSGCATARGSVRARWADRGDQLEVWFDHWSIGDGEVMHGHVSGSSDELAAGTFGAGAFREQAEPVMLALGTTSAPPAAPSETRECLDRIAGNNANVTMALARTPAIVAALPLFALVSVYSAATCRRP